MNLSKGHTAAAFGEAAIAREVQKSELRETLDDIGIARFFGRIMSGVVDAELGHEVIQEWGQGIETRPFMTRLGHLLFG